MPLHGSGRRSSVAVEGPRFTPHTILDNNNLSGVVKKRKVWAPNRSMREVHAQIRTQLKLLSSGQLQYATACVEGSNLLKHIQPHRGNQYICAYDLEAAYANTQPKEVKKVLRSLGASDELQSSISRHCFNRSAGLITGGPAAPELFNLYLAVVLDRRLEQLLMSRKDITYTRYLDDLLFSSPAPIGRRFRKQILAAVREVGFEISPGKAQVVDLASSETVLLNGIRLRVTGEVEVSKQFARSLHQKLRRALDGEEVNPQHLAGMMGAFYAIKPKGRHLNSREAEVDRLWRRYRFLQQHKTRARRADRQRRYRQRRRRAGHGKVLRRHEPVRNNWTPAHD